MIMNMDINKMDYLTYNESKALKEFKEKLLEKYSDAEIILYGSKARGDYGEYSDIDLLIIINDNYNIDKDISFKELEKLNFLRVNENIESEIYKIASEIDSKYDVLTSLVINTKSFLKTNLVEIIPLYKNIEKEGIAV